jgi:TPR repeat protein
MLPRQTFGWHYRDGIGLDRDEREALVWFQRAANLGNLWAMRNIGALYEHGQGVAKDCRKARDWYMKAAVSDHTDARKMLAALPVNCPEKP